MPRKRPEVGRRVAELRQALLRNDPELAKRWAQSAPRRRLSEALVTARGAAGHTQQRLAEIVGWPLERVVRMESATGPWPGPEELTTYAAACGRSVAIVFTHSDKAKSIHIDSVVALGTQDGDRLLERLAGVDVSLSGD
jgi:hypothetical protein